MCIQSIKFGNSVLEFRDTPWDEKIFGVKTKEILNIAYSKEEDIPILLDKFEKLFKFDGLIYSRQNARDIVLKKYFLQKGFYIAETAVKVKINKIQEQDFTQIFKRQLPIIEKKLTNDEILELKEIVRSFTFSRFHEDPCLDISLSIKRYVRWIDDLVQKNTNVLIYKNSQGNILSFLFYSTINNAANLILGGSHKNHGILTPLFYASVINYLKNNKEINKIFTTISVANVVIFNIYIKLGFKIEKSFFDYHKKITHIK